MKAYRAIALAAILSFAGGCRDRVVPIHEVQKPRWRAAATAAPPTPAALFEPSPEEIAAIDTRDPQAQLAALTLLDNRMITVDVIAAVRRIRATGREADERMRCLQSRYRDKASLEMILRETPRDVDWPSGPLPACYVTALSDRVAEDPQRIRSALLPYAVSMHAGIRDRALVGLRKLRGPFPEKMIGELDRYGSPGVDAALALGAVDYFPSQVEYWIEVPDERASTAEAALVRDGSPNAARIIARIMVRNAQSRATGIALKREDQFHDISSALAEIALDKHDYYAHRIAALDWLVDHGDVGVAPMIEPLTHSPSEEIRVAANSAFQALNRRRAQGFQPRAREITR